MHGGRPYIAVDAVAVRVGAAADDPAVAQVVQLLATLTPAERASGMRVRTGDRVRIEEVDPARNRCVVSYLGSGE